MQGVPSEMYSISTVLILNAKPVFGTATYRHTSEKIIMSYTFDGMTFNGDDFIEITTKLPYEEA